MKKVIKIILASVLAVLTLLLIAGLIIHQPRPEGTAGLQAEALADSMLSALNYNAYQKLEVIRWSYPRGHHYVWNKQENQVNVRWDSYDVNFDTQTLEGTAKKHGQLLNGKEAKEAVDQAWSYFANDSFWLVAPYKVRDPGTQRYLVETEAGPALLVTYTSGGVTPGDSYLWHLDEDYMPVAWQMWVKILPIGGLRFSWERWETIKGARFSTFHKGPIDIEIAELSSKKAP